MIPGLNLVILLPLLCVDLFFVVHSDPIVTLWNPKKEIIEETWSPSVPLDPELQTSSLWHILKQEELGGTVGAQYLCNSWLF